MSMMLTMLMMMGDDDHDDADDNVDATRIIAVIVDDVAVVAAAAAAVETQAMAELLGDDGMTPVELDEAFTWFDKASGVQVGIIGPEMTRKKHALSGTLPLDVYLAHEIIVFHVLWSPLTMNRC